MTTVATFLVPEEAYLFRCFLSNFGIEAAVFDEHTVQLVWHYSNAIGGVRVAVSDEDAEEACSAYRDYSSALLQVPRLITVARAWPLVLVLSFFIGVPMLLFGRRIVDPSTTETSGARSHSPG